MSTQYNTEPPPTASVLLHTTAGPLTISLFVAQTPLTSRNFLQHVLDGTYSNNLFHRVASGFVIQTGDPTGTGEGGENIYEDRDFERYDEHWARVMGREKGEKILFGDEVHSRLKFNRRGLVGMAKGTGDGSGYGSQFFVTLGDCRAELDGRCTMFGRVEGEGIYNVVKIAEGELVDGTERPVYPEKIISAEVLEMPKGAAWEQMKKRDRISQRVVQEPVKKKVPKKKAGKALLSFGGEDGEDDSPGVVVKPKKAKFNPALIDGGDVPDEKPKTNGTTSKTTRSPPPARRKERSPSLTPQSQIPQKRKASLSKSPSPTAHRRKPSFHDPTTQLPLRDPESPSRSPSPNPNTKSKSTTATLQAEIAALKASMRRDVAAPRESKQQKTALEALIPATSTRGRRRPRPGDSNTNGKDDTNALMMLSAFKKRLEGAGAETGSHGKGRDVGDGQTKGSNASDEQQKEEEEEEAHLCDLHFIANCQSCSNWEHHQQQRPNSNNADGDHPDIDAEDEEDADASWMTHKLSFAKDRLGKDLSWKKKNEEELVVIDPREREREVLGQKGKGKGREWGGKGK